MAWQDKGGPEYQVVLTADTDEFDAAMARCEDRLLRVLVLAKEVSAVMNRLGSEVE